MARELDSALISALSEDAVVHLLDGAAPGFGDFVRDFDSGKQAVADEDFCALFLIPGGVAPRAAAWMAGELERNGSQLCDLARAHLQRLHRQVAEGPWGNLPLDHVGLLLELGSLNEAAADELVLPWSGPFGAALATKATCPVYRATGEVLHSISA